MVKDCPCCKPPLVEVKVVSAPKACCDNSDPVTRQDGAIASVRMDELQPTSGTHHQATLENSVCSKHPGPRLFRTVQPLEMRMNAPPWNCTASTRFVSQQACPPPRGLCVCRCGSTPTPTPPVGGVVGGGSQPQPHTSVPGVCLFLGWQHQRWDTRHPILQGVRSGLVATPFCQSWCQSGECGAVPRPARGWLWWPLPRSTLPSLFSLCPMHSP